MAWHNLFCLCVCMYVFFLRIQLCGSKIRGFILFANMGFNESWVCTLYNVNLLSIICNWPISLLWRHNERDDVSNHLRLNCLLVCSGADQSKNQSSVALAFAGELPRLPVNSPCKGPVTRKMFPFDDVIMSEINRSPFWICYSQLPLPIFSIWLPN